MSTRLDLHYIFNRNSPNYAPFAGTTKAMGKFNRMLRNFSTKYCAAPNANLSGLEGNFSREDELLLKIHNEKVVNEEQRELDKISCLELQEKYRKQDLTHGLEAERKTKPNPQDDGNN